MQINPKLFDIVDLTAGGLLLEAVAKLGMSFTSVKLAEVILNNRLDDREELLASLQQLIDTNILLLDDEVYYANSDYIGLDD